MDIEICFVTDYEIGMLMGTICEQVERIDYRSVGGVLEWNDAVGSSAALHRCKNIYYPTVRFKALTGLRFKNG